MKRAFFPDPSSFSASLGLLVLRLIAGGAMMQHGWPKIQTPFSWMPAGSPVPGFLQALAALSEFGGGLALVLGFLTPLAMLGWIFTMGYAAFTHAGRGDKWVASGPGQGSFEPALGYLAVAVMFLLVGPGRFSLDYLLSSRSGPRGTVRATNEL